MQQLRIGLVVGPYRSAVRATNVPLMVQRNTASRAQATISPLLLLMDWKFGKKHAALPDGKLIHSARRRRSPHRSASPEGWT
jgi:hypothetical protein